MLYTVVFTINIRTHSLAQTVKKEFTFSLTIYVPVSKCTLFLENYTNLCEFFTDSSS